MIVARLLLLVFVISPFILVAPATIMVVILFIGFVSVVVMARSIVTVVVIMVMMVGMVVAVVVPTVVAMAVVMLLRVMVVVFRMVTYGAITVIDEVVQQEIDPHVLDAIVRSPFAEVKVARAPLSNFV